MGEGVSEGAVGKEEIVDAGLGKDVAEFGRLGRGGSRSGAGGGSELATQFESLKESAPSRINGGGVGFPGFVEFLKKSSVPRVAESAQGRRGCRRGAVRIEALECVQGGVLLWGGIEITHHNKRYICRSRGGRRVWSHFLSSILSNY